MIGSTLSFGGQATILDLEVGSLALDRKKERGPSIAAVSGRWKKMREKEWLVQFSIIFSSLSLSPLCVVNTSDYCGLCRRE